MISLGPSLHEAIALLMHVRGKGIRMIIPIS